MGRIHQIAVFVVLIALPSLFAHGDLHEQIAALDSQIALRANDPSLYLRRGDLHAKHREFRKAHADFDRALRLDPKLSRVDFLRGRAFYEAGQFTDAREAIDRFLQFDPKHTEALLTRARAKSKLGLHEEAAADFSRAIAASEKPNPEHYFERARALEASGNRKLLEQAVDGLDEGLRKVGPNPTLQILAIELETRLDRYDSAIARLENLSASSSRKEAFLSQKAGLLLKAGRSAEAKAALEAALASVAALPPQQRNSKATSRLETKIRNELAALN